jgi:hypothetical protein
MGLVMACRRAEGIAYPLLARIIHGWSIFS